MPLNQVLGREYQNWKFLIHCNEHDFLHILMQNGISLYDIKKLTISSLILAEYS